jgi:hypothetical protein
MVGAVCVLLGTRGAGASTDPLPPIQQETLPAVWEGISEAEPRVFRLVIPKSASESGQLFIAVGPPGHVVTMTFLVRRATVRRGRVTIDAAEVAGLRASVEGPGWAFRTGEGYIAAVVKLYAADGRPSTWRTTLHARLEGGFFRNVAAGVEALDKIRDQGESTSRGQPANPPLQTDGASRRR